MRISIVGEDESLGLFLKQGLEADGYQVHCGERAATGSAPGVHTATPDAPHPLAQHPLAPHSLPSHSPISLTMISDLMILDFCTGPRSEDDDTDTLAGPGAETEACIVEPERGFAKVRAGSMLELLRSLDRSIPVLALTAGCDAAERARLLDGGADDCMSRPLSLLELRARCRALLRRRGGPGLLLRCEGVEIDRVSHTVARHGQAVALTRREFALLEYLMMHRGYCVSRAALLTELWNGHAAADTNVVDVYINYLRRKLGGGMAFIQTVRGQGYCIGALAGRADGRDIRRLPGPADA